MMPQWIIEKKRDGHILDASDIREFLSGYTRGDIPDYQMAALAMAIYFRGMTPDETADLTECMMRSGDILDLSDHPLPKVDKHSTGGIGDKISLILAPLLASCGTAVPMISGRGLGITGGTLDKVEAIPGFRTRLSEAEFRKILDACGFVMAGQTERLAPADRKLYALRDVTGTVPSIPLITASILSKKLAEGVESLVMDVKCGRGAFMKTRADAEALADSILRVLDSLGCRGAAWITDMNQPLGRAVGNSLEVIESIETLQGGGPADVRDLTLALCEECLVLAGVESDRISAKRRLTAALSNGSALERFRKMIELQGGDPDVLDDPSRLPTARVQTPLTSPASGYLAVVDAEKIGRASLALGAGRTTTGDSINPAVGLADLVKVGEYVKKGGRLATLHSHEESRRETALALLKDAFVLSDQPPPAQPLLLGRHSKAPSSQADL